MTLEREIQQQLKDLLKSPQILTPAEVLSVNKTDKTVEVRTVDDLVIPDARLRPVIKNTEGIVIFPKVGTVVQVMPLGSDTDGIYIVATVEEAETIEAVVGNNSITWDSDGIKINDGSKGGLIEVTKLRTQVERNSDLLSQLQGFIKAWIPITQDGGAALKTALIQAGWTERPVADLSDIENKKITHG
jgi:hypothetical protein